MSPHLTKRQDVLNFHCPLGGDWYACASGSKFVGCCASDPCTNGCVQGNIYQGAFNSTMYGTFPDASCGLGSDFYTCAAAGETFWGCCKSKACAATPPTCPRGDLVPAFIDRPEQFNVYVSGASASATSSASAIPSSHSSGGGNSGAVIGGAVGGGVGAALIIGALIWFLCRRKKQRNQPAYTAAPVGETTHHPTNEKGAAADTSYYAGQSPPPTYSSPNPNMNAFSPHKPTQTPYQTYAYNAEVPPQELPGGYHDPSDQTTYAELPAGSSDAHRFSELPAGAALARAELESPATSPKPHQTKFQRDGENTGLGVSTDDEIRKH